MPVTKRDWRWIAAAIVFLPIAAFGADRPAVDSQIPDFTLPALDGGELELSDVYQERGAVLVVLRGWPGYQCPICTAQVAGYITERREFERRRFPVIFVYPGPAANLQDHARAFTARMDLPEQYRFVLDPDFEVTRDYGLRWDAEGETAYPATFIVDKDGLIVFRKISESHAGRVPANRVVELVDSRLLDTIPE